MTDKIQALLASRDGHRMPLVHGASMRQHDLTAGDIQPAAAFAGLLLYLGDWDGAHTAAQDIETRDGSYWHAIIHRQEPDAGNAGYWFRQVGTHPIFPELRDDAAEILSRHPNVDFSLLEVWSPSDFIDFCEAAQAQPGSEAEQVAKEIQHVEWKRLFDWCLTSK